MAAGPTGVQNQLRAKLRKLLTVEGAFAACALLIAVWLLYWPARAVQGPIAGDHSWRQAWTYSVAYNFVDESANFFFPRGDWRNDGTGIVGSEPPIYAYALSLLMRVFGHDPIVCRLPTWLVFVASLVVGWRMLRREGWIAESWLFVVAVALSPMALCDFKQVQPDPVCASLALIAAAVLRRSALDGSWRRFAVGLGVYTVAVLVKPIALAVGPAMFLFANLGAPSSSRRRWVRTALAFVIPIVLWAAWHVWAEHLTRTYAGGKYLISIELRPGEILRNLRSVEDWWNLLLFLLPAYVSSWWLTPALIAGLVLAFAARHRVLSLSFLAWMAGMLLAAGAFALRLRNNWYYCLLFLAPVAYFTAVGLTSLVRVCRNPRNAAASDLACATFLTLALPLGAWLASNTALWDITADGPDLGFWAHNEVWFGWTGLGSMLGLAILAVALGLHAPAAIGKAFVVARWLVVPLLLVSGRDAAVDAVQAVRSRSAEADWGATRRMMTEARAAVDRFSTRQDLFVVARDNPEVLHRMLRRGYADEPAVAAKRSSRYYAKRGVRFAMHYEQWDTPPLWMSVLPVLAAGEYTTLYCVDPKGCPALR
jgi:hypothetical protein